MAERRMFAKAIIGSGKFLRMPPSTRLLYYDLGMYADDDGIVEAFTVMRQTGATEDDLRVLVSKGFVRILNDELVTVINDWKVNNLIRQDRYNQSIYKDLLIQLNSETVNHMATNGKPSDNQRLPQVRLGKVSLREDSIDKDKAAAAIKDSLKDKDDVVNIEPYDSEEYRQQKPDQLVIYITNNLSGVNGVTLEEILAYRDYFSDDMIHEAVTETLRSGGRTVKYTERILNRWLDSGFKTLGDVKAAEDKREAAKGGKQSAISQRIGHIGNEV